MDVEACTDCDGLTPTSTRCGCCQRVLCRECATVEAGAVWCAACLDDARWFAVSCHPYPAQLVPALLADILEF